MNYSNVTALKSKDHLFNEFLEYLSNDHRYVILAGDPKTGPQPYNRITEQQLHDYDLPILWNHWLKQHGYKPHENLFEAFWYPLVKSNLTACFGKTFTPNAPWVVPDKSGLLHLNTYKSYQPLLQESGTTFSTDLTLFREFFKRLFPVQQERKQVIQFLSHMFQKPEERPSYGLMLSSDTGTGKGYLYSAILAPLLNRQCQLVSSYQKLTDRFASALVGTLLVMLDDPKSQSQTLHTQLKSVITEPYQLIEEKFKTPQTVKVYTRIILASNEHRPLKIEANERRWYAPSRIEHLVSREETQQFITKLDQWLQESGSLDKIYHYFMTRDLSDFNPRYCEQTSALLSMIEASVPVLQGEITEYVAEHEVFKWEELQEHCSELQGFKSDLVKHYLTELGYITKQVMKEGERLRLWFPAGMKPSKAAATYKELQIFS